MKKTKLPHTASTLFVQGELRLAETLDSRLIEFLRCIDQCGSINQAAKQMGYSYKGAWQIIERANNLAPKILINTATGGSKGGGTALTSAGRQLLNLFTDLESEHQQFLHKLNARLQADSETFLLLKHLAIKITANNQLFGTVANIELGAVYAEISIGLKGGEQIVSSLTLAEFNHLLLTPNQAVLLIINTPEITLLTGSKLNNSSARNALTGKIIRIQKDELETEVVIKLKGGDTLTVMLSQPCFDVLALKPNDSVTALFKSNAVMLGVLA